MSFPDTSTQVHSSGRPAHLPDRRLAGALQLLHKLRPVPHESQVGWSASGRLRPLLPLDDKALRAALR